MHTATMKLWERALLLQDKLEAEGIPVSHQEATDLLIADFIDQHTARPVQLGH